MIGSGLTKYRDCGLLLIRIGLGIAFIFHGWPKLKGGPATWAQLGAIMPVPPPTFWGFVGAIVEFGGGILLILGLLFRPVTLLLFLQMCVALFLVHLPSKDPQMSSFVAYSHALEDAIVFLGLFLIGPGKYSVDKQ